MKDFSQKYDFPVIFYRVNPMPVYYYVSSKYLFKFLLEILKCFLYTGSEQ